MNPEKRIDELINIINKASFEYYVKDNPTITDQEYDDYFMELLSLENKYPKLKRNDSPTVRVGGEALESFEKVTHKTRMTSFDDIFNEDEIRDFDNRIRKVVDNPEYTLEPKMDGLSGSLLYEKGILVRAATRGDGIVGEDITQNVKTIKSVPLKLTKEIDIEVRGEIYMSYDSFNRCNSERIKENQSTFANPRNAAAGSVRQLDSKITAKRNLDFMAYFIPNPEDYNLKTQSESLMFLKELGFKTNYELNNIAKNVEDILNYINDLGNKRKDLPFAIDGVVLKVDSLKMENILGYTSRVPRWGIAYKFPAEEVLTVLQDIIFTVGRTGKITPNAVFSPTHVDGSIVSKATLHNEDYCLEKDIRIKDVVVLRKAGDVIPEVSEVKFERRNEDLKPFTMIKECPICKTPLIKKGGVDYYCPNNDCPARGIEHLIHFASREAMNIDGLGDEIIERFYNDGILKNITDFYKIKDYEEEITTKDGFGKKSFTNMKDAIEKSKSNSLERLLCGLGIEGIGSKTAKLLAINYHNIDNLMKASVEDLLSIKDIGNILAINIFNYFQDNVDLINELKSIGINMEYIGEKTLYNEFITNKKFVITGTISFMGRNEIKAILEKYNGSVSESVSKNTDVVIVGENPGSKYDKAMKLGITIWNEEYLKNLMESINE